MVLPLAAVAFVLLIARAHVDKGLGRMNGICV
jgi:hypothetical protein